MDYEELWSILPKNIQSFYFCLNYIDNFCSSPHRNKTNQERWSLYFCLSFGSFLHVHLKIVVYRTSIHHYYMNFLSFAMLCLLPVLMFNWSSTTMLWIFQQKTESKPNLKYHQGDVLNRFKLSIFSLCYMLSFL